MVAGVSSKEHSLMATYDLDFSLSETMSKLSLEHAAGGICTIIT